MNIFEMRKQANLYAYKNAQVLVPIFIFVELVLLAVMMVSNQILSILLSLFLATITHAYVITALNIIEEKQPKLKNSLIGFKDFTRLFPSYFMRKIIINIVSIALLIPTIVLISSKTGFAAIDLMDWLQLIIVTGIEDLSALPVIYDYLTTPFVVVSFILASFAASLVSYGLALMPYLVEKQDISWNEAISKSWKMMKGHKRELFYLRLSYLPQLLFVAIVIQLVTVFFSFSLYLATFVSLILSIYLPIMFYQPHFEIANALFYKELINQEEHPDLFVL